MKADVIFEDLGYLKEYWLETKFLGSIKTDKDREVMGYYGAKVEVLEQGVILSNKKKIKAGTTVLTLLYPLCGRTI